MSHPMTDTIERLRQLLAKATPGPWKVFTPDHYEGPNDLPTLGVEAETGEAVVWYAERPESGLENDADAALIAEAITALPALLADLTRLQALERRWEEAERVLVSQHAHIGPMALVDSDELVGQRVRLVREDE